MKLILTAFQQLTYLVRGARTTRWLRLLSPTLRGAKIALVGVLTEEEGFVIFFCCCCNCLILRVNHDFSRVLIYEKFGA
jgi:hypothetical protein